MLAGHNTPMTAGSVFLSSDVFATEDEDGSVMIGEKFNLEPYWENLYFRR